MVKLNLGCGADNWGDIRIDMYPSKTTTHILDFENQKLSFIENNSVDEVRLIQVLEHLKNRENIIKEIHRVLKPNGLLTIKTDYAGFIFWTHGRTEHNEYLKRYYLSENLGHNQHKDRHYSLFLESHIKELLGDNFEEFKTSYQTLRPNIFIYLFLRLLPRKRGMAHITLNCQKI
jgi:ubiquinone/menaquinone biosynthesis C-methylase UbiE